MHCVLETLSVPPGRLQNFELRGSFIPLRAVGFRFRRPRSSIEAEGGLAWLGLIWLGPGPGPGPWSLPMVGPWSQPLDAAHGPGPWCWPLVPAHGPEMGPFFQNILLFYL